MYDTDIVLDYLWICGFLWRVVENGLQTVFGELKGWVWRPNGACRALPAREEASAVNCEVRKAARPSKGGPA